MVVGQGVPQQISAFRDPHRIRLQILRGAPLTVPFPARIAFVSSLVLAVFLDGQVPEL